MIETPERSARSEPSRKFGRRGLLLALLFGMGLGAWGVGQRLRPTEKMPAVAMQDGLASEKYDVDPAQLPTDSRSSPSLLVVPERLGGIPAWTPAAAPDNPAKEAEALRDAPKAPETAAALAPKDDAPQAPSGGRLNGGPGMFGGVSRPFGQRLGETRGLSSPKAL